MNKFLFLGFVFLSILTSCDKDDEGSNGKIEKDNVLLKTWYKHAGYSSGETLYDEFIFNSDSTFEHKILTMSFNYRTINGTYRILERTIDYAENDYIEAYIVEGYNVKTKFVIEFNPFDDESETVKVMFLENRNNSNRKAIAITTPLFGRDGGNYTDTKNHN